MAVTTHAVVIAGGASSPMDMPNTGGVAMDHGIARRVHGVMMIGMAGTALQDGTVHPVMLTVACHMQDRNSLGQRRLRSLRQLKKSLVTFGKLAWQSPLMNCVSSSEAKGLQICVLLKKTFAIDGTTMCLSWCRVFAFDFASACLVLCLVVTCHSPYRVLVNPKAIIIWFVW